MVGCCFLFGVCCLLFAVCCLLVVVRCLLLVWVLLLVLQVVLGAVLGAVQEDSGVDEYDSGKGGNGRDIVRREFPDRLTDLCDGIEDHEHNSGVKKAGTAYFPAGDSIICSTLVASVTVN